ncbi:Predicted dehydrogenase [Paenibacillus uliginis N3/975]|uniref:Predicted dehydrogenase n=1 Tax=Paenibacillus uliginis N3/975 TaxID=1313296 RepID=A0A1X7HTE5_9BACL|nr:Gfo/Idh/MocA family oxidoreductase [Paenibacillus uliginis]SMF91730.1 Predicted dehydrogenase [Paenibacillus uliginis N3/975]
MNSLRIGLIGLDTSHALAFTRLLHDTEDAYHVPGARVVAAYPGGSPDFSLSISRVNGFTEDIKQKYGVRIMDTPEEVAEHCDALMLLSADGRVHLDLFRKIAPYGKPVFIDKPLALQSSEAEEIGAIAARHGVPVMSSSSLRYAVSLTQELDREGKGNVIGADVHGPMEVESTQSYYFWYGIHAAEMLFAIMGPGCREVIVSSTEVHELITGTWDDGRIGTVRGNRGGNFMFGALIHRTTGSDYVDAAASGKPFYADLLEQVMPMFASGKTVLPFEQSVEIIRFLEAAEESRTTGCTVKL